MPVAIVGTGSGALWAPTEGSVGTGSAVCVAPLKDGDGTGSATVNRAHFLAWGQRPGGVPHAVAGYNRLDRWARANVTVGGQDVSDSLVGETRVVETDESPVMTATFGVRDPRVVIDDPDSIADGEQDVTIEFEVGPPGREEALQVFRGVAASAPNDEPWGPRASFTAESHMAELLDAWVCLVYPAYSGVRRGAILTEAAAQAGVVLTGSFAGAVINRPFRYVGTLAGLLKLFSELEGWIYREVVATGQLEVVTESEYLGDPVFTFSEEDGISYPPFRQEPVSRPVTTWVFAGTMLAPPAAGTYLLGSREAGSSSIIQIRVAAGRNPYVTRYERADLATVTPYASQQVVRRLVIEQRYPLLVGASNPFENVWGARIITRTTRDRVGLALGGYVFDPLTRESLITETWTWDVLYCYLRAYSKTTRSTVDGVTSQEILTEKWLVSPTQVQRSGTIDWRAAGGSFVAATDTRYGFVETWTRDAMGDGWTYDATYSHEAGDDLDLVPDDVAGQRGSGELPTPPAAAAADEPLFTQQPFVVRASANATVLARYRPLEKPDSELSAFLENPDEAIAVAQRRFRRDFAERYVVTGRILPHLRVAHSVELLNSSRQIETARRGWISTREAGLGHPNGDTNERRIVTVGPSWAPAIEVAVEVPG